MTCLVCCREKVNNINQNLLGIHLLQFYFSLLKRTLKMIPSSYSGLSHEFPSMVIKLLSVCAFYIKVTLQWVTSAFFFSKGFFFKWLISDIGEPVIWFREVIGTKASGIGLGLWISYPWPETVSATKPVRKQIQYNDNGAEAEGVFLSLC